MPVLMNTGPGFSSGSYLSNRITAPQTVSNQLQSDEQQKQAAEIAAKNVFDTVYDEHSNESFAGRMGMFMSSGVIDVVDTLGSVLPNVDRGDIWNAAADIGLDGMADWQARNKSGVELTSGLLLSVGTGYMVEKYAFGALASRLMQSTSLTGSALTKLSSFVPKARATALAAQESDAALGVLSRVATPATQEAIKNFYAANAASHVGKAVVTEGAIALLGHNNEAIWSDDMANNMFWFGLGIAIPGAAGALQARAEMRAAANTTQVMEARRAALDPNDYIKDRDIIGDPSIPFDANQRFKQSALVTELAFEARQQITSNASPELKTALSQQGLQTQIALQSELKKLAAIKVEQYPFKRLDFDDASVMRTKQRAHVMKAVEEDPSVFEEVVSLGVPTSLRENLKAAHDNVDNLLKSNIPEDVIKGQRLAKQKPMILINGHWYDATGDAIEFAEFHPNQVKIQALPKLGGQAWSVQFPGGHQVQLTSSAKIPGKPFSQRPVKERLGLIQALKSVSSRMLVGKPNLRPKYVLADSDDFIQNEFALLYAKKGGPIDFSKSRMKTIEDVQFAAIKNKIAAMKTDGIWGKTTQYDNWTRKKYNLPEASQVERIHDGSSKALQTVLESVDSGAIKSYAEAKQLYNDILNRHELVATTRHADREFTGDMWTFNESQKGEWYDPIIAYHEVSTKNPLRRGTRAQLAEELAVNKQVVYYTMSRNVPGNSVVARVNEAAHMTPEGQGLFKIGGNADNQVTGVGQNLGAEAGSVLPTIFRGRDNVMLPSSVKMAQQAQDIAQDVTKSEHLFLQESALKLNSSVNAKSRELYNHWRTVRPGFDLKANGAIRGQDGLWRFELEETANNANILGRPVIKGEFMPSHITGQEAVLDDIGMEFYSKLNRVMEKKRLEENLVRKALGLSEIRHTPYYAASEDTKGKFIAFVVDSKTGNVIPQRSIIADSAEDFQKQRDAAYQTLAPHEYLHTQDEIAFTQDLYDQSQQAWVNNKFIGRVNASATGKLSGAKIRQNMVEQDLKYIQDKNVHLANATLRTVYADQIQLAKTRRVMTRLQYGLQKETLMNRVGAEPKTIWDDFLQNIAGPEIAQVPRRAITKVLDSFESAAQKVLSSWPGLQKLPPVQAANYIKDAAIRMGVPLGKVKGAKDFDELTKAFAASPQYLPYKSLDDYVDQVSRAGKPPEVRQIAAKLNRWDASWRLRYFELPNAAMNMLGIITNMPAILANSRTPVIGQLVSGSGKRVGIVDSMKLIMDGTTETLKRTYQADWAYAKKHGGLKPGVAEIREIMSTFELTKGNPSAARLAWRKAFLGDKTIKNATVGTPDWFRYHGIDGLISRANDGTEEWSRMWAHGIGLKLADLHGITGDAARFNFANSIADQAIANYSPLNRGELFQSAFGSLFGLYQTYAMNYTSRMFRYLEQGDYRALMRQAAMQTAMFGTSSNLGWNQLEWLEDKATGDDATLSDMVYARFGPIVGSTLSHGGVADMAEVFGAPSGIAIYTRGDTNVRFNMLPTDSSGAFDFTKMSAALGTLKQLGEGTIQMAQTMWNDDSIVTGQRLSEIAANMVPNRTIKGLITVGLNDGYETDRYGAVTAVNQGVFESTIRMMGLRTTRQQDEIDAYYANRSNLDKMASRMEQLREETRGVIRAGSFEEKLPVVFENYLQNGGDPSMFKPWVRQTLESATTTRALRDMNKAINSRKMQAMAARYGFVDN